MGKNWLIYGVVAFAAYFLFFHKPTRLMLPGANDQGI